ncbi:MAG TPA: hypothetical protein VM680_08915 [Verrucomicrobiae bacterium]|nr:hypothetical protein [Verrucomicrobiae bacterium]
MRILVAALLFCISVHAQDWQSHFAKIPIRGTSFRAHLTPPLELILTNFNPTPEIRAVVLMPGAADRLYFYDWGEVTLPKNPTLLDAITALTNAADLRVFLAPPFLLIGRQYDDPSDPLSIAAGVSTEKLKLNERKPRGRTYFLDRPYDRMVPQAEKISRLKLKPTRRSFASWHFYRLAFVGYDLTAAEFLRAVAYGAKCSVTIDRKRATFEPRQFAQ